MSEKPLSEKEERRAASEIVRTHHREQLELLLDHVVRSIDEYRAGKQDVYDVDDVIFQNSRATKELWKFSNLQRPPVTVRRIGEGWPSEPDYWWDLGEPKRPRNG